MGQNYDVICSTLYLYTFQAYRGYSILVFDPRHATTLTELTERERALFVSDLCRAQEGLQRVLKPDHFDFDALVTRFHIYIGTSSPDTKAILDGDRQSG